LSNLTQHNTALQKTGEATISESHKTPVANTSPSRRGRHRSIAAGRSNKMDLGFPLTQSGGQLGPRTRLQGGSGTRRCHRGPHRQRRTGFSPGRRPHSSETETVGSMHREHHHRKQLVDEEEHVDHRRRSTPARQGGTEMVPPKRAGTPLFWSKKLRPPLTLRKTRGPGPHGRRRQQGPGHPHHRVVPGNGQRRQGHSPQNLDLLLLFILQLILQLLFILSGCNPPMAF
jgi:hypothetical protein